MIRKFLPFIILWGFYYAIVFIFQSPEPMGDEIRHLNYADNLSHGYYENTENPSFRNGPGYPLLIAPFVGLGLPLIWAKMLNPILLILALVYFKKTLTLYTTTRVALYASILLGLYIPMLRWLPFLYSESLAFFITCGFIYHVCCLFKFKEKARRNMLIASLFLGFLVLTKIIFFQVVLVSSIITLVVLIGKNKSHSLILAKVLMGGLIVISPYLFYAYKLTGKSLYLGSGGGEILYHRATPFKKEFGNWFSREDVLYGADEEYKMVKDYGDLTQLSKNHRNFYLSLEGLSHIERDSAFKKAAIENMKAHPLKYAKNTSINIFRLVVNYPFSYRGHGIGMFGYMIPNMFLVVFFTFSVIILIRTRMILPFEIRSILLFILIYAGGILLLEGRGRNFIVITPYLLLFTVYVLGRIGLFKLNKASPKIISPSNQSGDTAS